MANPFVPTLTYRTFDQLIYDFQGPQTEQIKLCNMIYSMYEDLGNAVDSVNGQIGVVVLDAADVGAVALTGNESVAGVKTFTSSPIVPDPTTDGQAANKGWVDDQSAATLASAAAYTDTAETDAIAASAAAVDARLGSDTDRTDIAQVDQLSTYRLRSTPAPTTKNATGALSAAEVLSELILVDTSGGAVVLTMPTGSDFETALAAVYGALEVGDTFEMSVQNIDAAQATINSNTGMTVTFITTVDAFFYARFLIRRTAADTFTAYRV